MATSVMVSRDSESSRELVEFGVTKEKTVDVPARITSGGRVTVPKTVREAPGLHEGDAVHFRVEGERAVLARTPHFLELAGTFKIPESKRNVAWDQIVKSTRASRAKKYL